MLSRIMHHASRGMSPKHIPLRTCIGCGQVESKRTLVRVVRTPDAGVQIDATGKRSGRGAYIHARPECWQAALKRGAIERALAATLTTEERNLLQEYVTNMAQ
jgi:predicted RNA-binding protein YlxR (DUF448 family)